MSLRHPIAARNTAITAAVLANAPRTGWSPSHRLLRRSRATRDLGMTGLRQNHQAVTPIHTAIPSSKTAPAIVLAVTARIALPRRRRPACAPDGADRSSGSFDADDRPPDLPTDTGVDTEPRRLDLVHGREPPGVRQCHLSNGLPVQTCNRNLRPRGLDCANEFVNRPGQLYIDDADRVRSVTQVQPQEAPVEDPQPRVRRCAPDPTEAQHRVVVASRSPSRSTLPKSDPTLHAATDSGHSRG